MGHLFWVFSTRIIVRHTWSTECIHTQDPNSVFHYNDVTMSAIAPQVTSLTIVYSNFYSRRRSKKTSKLRVTGFCAGKSPETGEFPAKRASNAEIVSIWWRHHGTAIILVAVSLPAVALFFVFHCHIAYIWPRKFYILLLPLCRDNYFRITSQMFTYL